MNRIALVASLLGVVSYTAGQEVVQRIAPAELQASGELPESVRFAPADALSSSDYLLIENAAADGQPIRFATIVNPKISLPIYAISGEVRHENVGGEAYLMMLNYFPDGGPFFSKGIAPDGPMRVISGNSDWRSFVLPFYCVSQSGDDSGKRPIKIELFLVLPGSGRVYVRNMRLTQFALGANPLASTGQWWSGAQAGVVWVGLAGLFVCIGALIAYLAIRGRGRGVAIAFMCAVIVLGAALLILAVVALTLSQPSHVYYPLFEIGGLFVLLPAVLFPRLQRRYAEMELRKMSAIDAA